ncbi:MAG: hypothetical protein WC340_10430 [Kiritimatiellia bacterium]
MEELIAETRLAATKTFTSTGPFALFADGLQGLERVEVERTGPSGVPGPATCGEGKVFLTKNRNSIPSYLPGEIVWTVTKLKTDGLVSVGATGEVTV